MLPVRASVSWLVQDPFHKVLRLEVICEMITRDVTLTLETNRAIHVDHLHPLVDDLAPVGVATEPPQHNLLTTI